jgi:hypothetical protein
MTPFISSTVTNKKPAGASILRRACLETGIPLPGLVTARTAAKINVKARQADVSATATVTGAMAGAVPAAMTRTRTAAMAHGAPSIDGLTAVVAARINALTIHRRPARTAGVRVAAARGVMMISRLHSGRSENGETGSDSQQSDELFHIELGLIRCRQMSGLSQQTRPAWNYSVAPHLF